MIRRRWSLILISQISLWANFLIEIVEKNGPFFERAPLFEILVFFNFWKVIKTQARVLAVQIWKSWIWGFQVEFPTTSEVGKKRSKNLGAAA